jgi:hypothetical protein
VLQYRHPENGSDESLCGLLARPGYLSRICKRRQENSLVKLFRRAVEGSSRAEIRGQVKSIRV